MAGQHFQRVCGHMNQEFMLDNIICEIDKTIVQYIFIFISSFVRVYV